MPPAPKGAAHGKVNFKAMNMGVIKRLLRYLNAYRWQLIVVLLCILVSSITISGDKEVKAGGKIQVRIPTIPMFNESKEHFVKYGEFLSKIKDGIDIIQLLPYHKLGVSKHQRLMKKEKIFVAEPPSDQLMQDRKKQLEAYGLTVTIH